MVDILQSGGAFGADMVFDDCARKAGHQIKHYSFEGHRLQTKDNAVILNNAELMEADPYLQRANETLKRRIPRGTNDYVMNLLRRNWYQIKDAERVYAVAPLNTETGLLEGGTAWAVQMAIDAHIPQIYLYDLDTNEWKWRDDRWPGWWMDRSGIHPYQPPRPHGTYTGIGTRELTKEGEEAIRQLYDYEPLWQAI